MSHHECRGCHEYDRLSRRHFLALSAGVAAAAAVPEWLPRIALADSQNSSRDVLVSIFQRGGSDGLSLCVPFGEAAYYGLRPSLAVAPPDSSDPLRAIDLDGFFGFPPGMAPLLEAFQQGSLALIHACGFDNPTRSHFDAMHFMEVGVEDPSSELSSGWLGRHLLATEPVAPQGLLRAVGIEFGLPRTLIGGPRTLPIPDLAEFGLGGNPASAPERRRAIEAMYAGVGDPVKGSAESTLGTIDLLHQIDFASYQPGDGAVYPESDFGRALRSTAALIKAEVGVEAVAIDVGGWDTHEFQGPVDGKLNSLMTGFASGLAAFHRDLFSRPSPGVTVVAMSEFGRNAFENGSGGTDHGHGGLMMVLGDHVEGGRVIADWPGLENEQLYEGQDLAITIDYRDVLTEILTKRLANPDFRTVFTDPAFTPTDRGILRAGNQAAAGA